ncbi:MAG: hypothetical protein OXI81_18160 [Paracoccaceae bacterium]|nr:hypothetical protein [Paracoccaceae bacterium]
MGDSQTDARTGSDATARAETARLRGEVGRLREQLADRDERLAELAELIRGLRDEIRRLKKLPRRPDLKPSGLAASNGGDTDTSASGSPGSGRSKTGSRKVRGHRRRNPHLRRRDVTVVLDDVPEGAVHKGYQDHTVRDMVFHAEEVTDGSRHVAPLPPGVATGREPYGPGVKALAIMALGHVCAGRSEMLRSLVGGPCLKAA